MDLNQVIQGDCQEVMKGIEDNSIDTIITDPPYGLGNDPDIAELLNHWLDDKDYDTGPGFMSKGWDVVPGPSVWRECFRVMKPGGCLLAFGGTRTVDLLSIAIRMAGFQRFDEIVWLHAQGFGKGLDISKKLDEIAGVEREVIGTNPNNRPNGDVQNTMYAGGNGTSHSEYITAPATDAARLWSGYKTQLKPAHEVILCFWKPRDGGFAANALKWGVAGLWIDGARIATGDDLNGGAYSGNTPQLIKDVYGEYSKLKPEDYKQPSGRYPANVLITHAEGCVRVGEKRVRSNGQQTEGREMEGELFGNRRDGKHYADPDGLETVEDWRCVESCPVRALDEMAGVRKSRPVKPENIGKSGSGEKRGLFGNKSIVQSGYYEDSAAASRFFYTAKASGREKWFYCQICGDAYPYADREDHAHGKPKGKRKHQIAHPTVKPLALLDYLCKLTRSPTGGIVLDPFAGSGTTGEACLKTGREFILIENDPLYYQIAKRRLDEAMAKPRQLSLIEIASDSLE